MHATKRQDLYTKSLAQTVQTYICTCRYIVSILGREFCLMCKFWVVCVLCHPHIFVSMYIIFICLIICLEVKYVPCIFLINIKRLQNNIFLFHYMYYFSSKYKFIPWFWTDIWIFLYYITCITCMYIRVRYDNSIKFIHVSNIWHLLFQSMWCYSFSERKMYIQEFHVSWM